MLSDSSLTRHKEPNEQFRVAWDFTNDLETGDTVTGAVVKAYDAVGLDVSGTIISGSPTIVNSATTIKVTIHAGTVAVNYFIQFKATTSQGDVFIRVLAVSVKQ